MYSVMTGLLNYNQLMLLVSTCLYTKVKKYKRKKTGLLYGFLKQVQLRGCSNY
jgi:hypothetical protein